MILPSVDEQISSVEVPPSMDGEPLSTDNINE